MRVDVFNRQQIEWITPDTPRPLISIGQSRCEDCLGTRPENMPPDEATLQAGWGDVLRLSFHDFTYQPKGDCWVVFTPELAAETTAFIEAHAGQDFAIHCAAGISRSVAVGVFMRDAYDYELFLHAIDSTAGANSLVLRLLNRPFWEKRFGAE